MSCRRLGLAASALVASVLVSLSTFGQSLQFDDKLAERQLLVLFDHDRPDSPSIAQIIDAARNSLSNPRLSSDLGFPVDARKMLSAIDVPTRSVTPGLVEDRRAARQLLDQYLVFTYDTISAAVLAEATLRRDGRVLGVQRDRAVHYSSAVPNDTYFSYSPVRPYNGAHQWGMAALNLPNAWSRARGNAYIAVLDNGVYCSADSPCSAHGDLLSVRNVFSKNFTGVGLPTAIDELLRSGVSKGHGTHVAGIVAASSNNGAGVAGACWNCSLGVMKILSFFGDGTSALTFASDIGMQVANLSFGDERPIASRFTSCTDQAYSPMCLAIQDAKNRDVAVVAAAGNGYEERIQFPASHVDTIAVGGIEYGGGFWNSGYGSTCTSPPTAGDQCGSNYGSQVDGITKQVVAPARDVVSTFYPGAQWAAAYLCADTFGPSSGILSAGYGDCTGTSMAAPHVSGIVGIVRSVNPLLTAPQIKALLLSDANTVACTGADLLKCGAGIPDADRLVAAALGGKAYINRLTPLFSFYSASRQDHFYTVVPQMGASAVTSKLLPTSYTAAQHPYGAIGPLVSGYSGFPGVSLAGCGFSPPCDPLVPRAMVSVFTLAQSPIIGGPDLVPLYRLSWACPNSSQCPQNSEQVSHGYSTDPSESWNTVGYRLDGIEGYVFPRSMNQPPGTVKLCRKRDGNTGDYILFPGTAPNGTNCTGTTDGYSPGSYDQEVAYTDFIGWVYSARVPQAVADPRVLGALATTIAE